MAVMTSIELPSRSLKRFDRSETEILDFLEGKKESSVEIGTVKYKSDIKPKVLHFHTSRRRKKGSSKFEKFYYLQEEERKIDYQRALLFFCEL